MQCTPEIKLAKGQTFYAANLWSAKRNFSLQLANELGVLIKKSDLSL